MSTLDRYNSAIRRRLGVLSRGYTSFHVQHKLNQQPHSKGTVASCLFGDITKHGFEKRYVLPFLNNCKLVHQELPGWCMRVYVSPSLSPDLITKLIENGCEVYVMSQNSKGYIGTMWRFLPASEKKPFVTHDADMLLDKTNFIVPNLSKNIDKWLKTDKTFFQRTLGVINHNIPISAGMWGAKPTKEGFAPIPDIQERLEKYNDTLFGCDEAFLTREVWPLFKRKTYYRVRNGLDIAFVVYWWILLFGIFLLIKIIHR